jgi:type II secretory ATPase GspE/PulE/Tfp pilus assembly ATPase PilB-like protein
VALKQQILLVNDVYDEAYLASIHPELRFDVSADFRSGFLTRSVASFPLKAPNRLLGVFQMVNCTGNVDAVFGEQEISGGRVVAQILATKLSAGVELSPGPFSYLLLRNLVSVDQLQEYSIEASQNKTSIFQILMQEGGLTIEEIGASLEHYYKVPFMAFDPQLELDNYWFNGLSRDFLIRKRWVPVGGTRSKAVVLIDDPNDADRIAEIQQALNAPSYEFRVGLTEDILRFLGLEDLDFKQADDEHGTASGGMENVSLDALLSRMKEEKEKEKETATGSGGEFKPTELLDENAAAVVQLVNKLIADAINDKASDIHIEPSKGPQANVRFRIDGDCRPFLEIPSDCVRAVVARIKVMSRLDITETRLPQDGKMTVRLQNDLHELRVATIPTVVGEGAVLRVLATANSVPFDKLNLSPRNLENSEKLLGRPHGIFLVVGPTGSGKTTTLHAYLSRINTPERKIWTAEDPVEITQPGLQQVQVQSKIGFSFAAALRSFLRADPDVILIGEIRDHETAQSAIEASLTGHLVFSTLHTNSAPETITRLLDMGLNPINFADALVGVLAQRLVRTLCADCKESYSPSAEEIERLSLAYGLDYVSELNLESEEVKLCRPVGCSRCGNTGYRGRTGIHELLVASQEMKSMIARGQGVAEIRALAMKEGMRTLLQDGVMKILNGQCDIKQLTKVVAE